MGTTATRPDRRKRTSGQINLPARATDRVQFSADFGKRFSVFVYTQETFNKETKVHGAGGGIQHVPEFQRIVESHGVIPTYLLNYTLAMSGVAQDILGPITAAGHAVIGAQLQPWSTPPCDEEHTAHNSYVGNLPIALERAKLEQLTDAIANYFGQRPQVFRAGRYGVGPNTAHVLSQAGYRLDVSVRPRFDYRADGGPDFRRHDARPYWAGAEHTLIALPVGACYTGWARRAGIVLYEGTRNRPKVRGAMARSGALARIALTPEDMPLADVKEAIRVMLNDGVQVFSFAMHAPSLSPGNTPYVRTSADLNALYRWWEDIFSFLDQNNVRPIASDAIIAAAWATR